MQAPKRTNLEERYRLGEVLGRGGMGVVYKAFDTMLKREVALKTILDIENTTTLELFYKECGTLAGMVHPNIISIYDLGEFEHGGVRKPFFVMPLLPGATLDQLIRENSPRLTVEGVVDIVGQACRGLHAAHEMGLVHRDVKPSNVFVLADGSVKIIDFGIARQAAANTQTTLKGTLPYMPPEGLQMKPPTPQGDQYALAVICYEALARRRPFRGSTEGEVAEAILHASPPPISDLNPNVKYGLSQVVHKALAKQPWHRFYTVKEFGDALLKASRGEALEYFDEEKIRPRLERASTSFDNGDYEFASEILSELEAEGYLDQGVALLRRRVDQAARQRRVKQLLDSANRYFEACEFPLALRKIQESLELDPENTDALSLKSRVERQRREKKIDEWIQLARRHMENQAFRQAREALDNVLKIKPNDTAALSLMADVDRREKEFSQTREKKSSLYQAAMQAWERGEVTAALSKLDGLLLIERENPDTDSDRSNTYQSFYNKVRSEHDDLKNSYEQAKRDLSSDNFESAFQICRQYLTKYPNHALFQALNFDVEERQRQKLSAFIAETDRRADEEPDLDRRYTMLEEAGKAFPDEKHFQTALKLVKDKRDLVNSIVNKARYYEERSQFNEALDQWQIIKSIHASYPGLIFEIDRLANRRDQQLRQTARALVSEDVERHLDAGNYERALKAVRAARAEFPADPELPELEKLVVKNSASAAQAAALLSQARELSDVDKLDESLRLLREAKQLDPRNSVIQTVLVNTLLDQAGRRKDAKEWDAAQPLIHELLEIQPNHAAAISLQNQVADSKREEFVSWCLAQARRLQTQDDYDGALALVQQGLDADPKEPRLQQLRSTLLQRQAEFQTGTKVQFSPPTLLNKEPPSAPQPQAKELSESLAATVISPVIPPALQETKVLDPLVTELDYRPEPPRPLSPPLLPPPHGTNGKVVSPPPKPIPPVKRDRRSLYLAIGGAAAVVGLLGIALVIGRKPAHKVPPGATTGSSVKVVVHSNPGGAGILVDGKPCGTGQCDVSLDKGAHRIEGHLDGFAPAVTDIEVKPGEPMAPVELSLVAQLPTMVVSTNLTGATLALDSGQGIALQNGEAQIPGLETGPHTVRFQGEHYVATFSVSAAPGQAAAVDPLPKEMLGVTVGTALGPDFRVYSNLLGAVVSLDGKNSGRLDKSEYALNGLGPGSHEVTLTPASGPPHRLQFVSGPVPMVVAFIGADKNVGTLQIDAGEDDATVYINGVKQKRLTSRGGHLWIYPAPGTYKIRLEKDGFQPVPEQSAEIKVGQSVSLAFHLVRTPTSASIVVKDAPPGAEVLIDGKKAGVAGGDGSFTASDVAPGRHTILIHKDGYKPHSLEQSVIAGTTADVDGTLVSAMGTLKLEISPAEAKPTLTVKRNGEDAARPVTDTTLTLPEGDYTITGTAPGYQEVVASARVAAGKAQSVPLAFKSSPTPKLQVTRTMSTADWEKAGGWQEDGKYLRRKGGNTILLPVAGTGRYDFVAKMLKGKRLEWYVNYQDDRNYIQYQIEDDHFNVTTVSNGARKQLGHVLQIKRDDWITVGIDVSENAVAVTVQQKDQNGSDSVSGTHFGAGHFGFHVPGRDELELSGFRFIAK